MGTETLLRLPALQERKNALIKLNNPLMGTETVFVVLLIFLLIVMVLN